MLNLSTKYTTIFALFWAIALFSWGCRKDVVEIRPYSVTQPELSAFLKQVPDQSTKSTFQFNGLSQDKILELPGGMRVALTDVDQLFSSTSSPTPIACSTCSDLRIEITLATRKGDILSRELPTVSSDHKLLESGGMVELKAFCGNTALQLLPGRTIKVQLPAPDPKDNLFVYTPTSDQNGFAGWESTGQEVFKADWPGQGGNVKGYEVIVSHLGWSNCARVLTPADVSPFCVDLNPGYTAQNTQAYLVFDNVLTIAPLQFDDLTHSFCFPNVPAGYPVRVVSVAKLGAEYYLGEKNTETGTNSTLHLQLEKQAALEVLGYLRGL